MFTLSQLASSATRLGSALTKMASMRYLAAFALAGVATASQAANFVSVHQFPLKIALQPTAGSLEYPRDVRTGFKQQYAPDGASGCAIGFTRTGCAFPGGGSLSLPEYTGYQLQAAEYRIFIPAGTKSFLFSGYAPQRAVAAFALRYGAPPNRTAGLSGAEYQTAQSTEKIDTAFSTLVTSRSDLIVVHDGGGTVRFSGGQLAGGATTTEGNWLYVRQLVGTPLYDVQGAIDVDMPKYAAGYAKISWTSGQYPDPVEGASPGGGTGTGTGTTPAPSNNNVTLATKVVSTATQPLKLDITLSQSAPNVGTNPKISVWLATFLPSTNTWYFRLSSNTWTTSTDDIDAAAYFNNAPNVSVLKLSPQLQFTENELKAAGAKVFFGYKTSSGVFINKGQIWPK